MTLRPALLGLALATLLACQASPGDKPASPAPAVRATETPVPAADASRPAAQKAATPPAEADRPAAPAPAPQAAVAPSDPSDPAAVFALLKELATTGRAREMTPYFTMQMMKRMPRLPDENAKKLFEVEFAAPVVNGGVAIFPRTATGRPSALLLYNEKGQWKFDVEMSMRWERPSAGEPNPLNAPLSLDEALAGLPGSGDKLVAVLKTSRGTLTCTLLPDVAPKTVANFVGLARGLRGFLDPKTKTWVKRPFYDGLAFHRVIPKFMIQGGCPLGNGTGGPGYTIDDEFKLGLTFDKPGLLAMANSGPNTNGSQFFVTEVTPDWLNYRHTIFGQCDNLDLVKAIAAAGNTPPTVLEAVTFHRE
jgi:peptidyl-prolyl cis-trans isomerase A (cyclophilin A)